MDVDLFNISSINLTPSIKYTVAVVYRTSSITILEQYGDKNPIETKNSIFYFSELNYKVIIKKVNDNEDYLNLAFYPNFKNNSYEGYILANPNNYFVMESYFKTQFINVTLKNSSRYAVFSSSPDTRDVSMKIEKNGFSKVFLEICDENGTTEIVNDISETMELINNRLFVLFLEVSNAEECSVFISSLFYSTFCFDVNAANVSSFTTGSYESEVIMNVKPAKEVALCISENECKDTSLKYPIYKGFDAYTALAEAYELKSKELFLHVIGTGVGKFLCKGFKGASLKIASDDFTTHAVFIDFQNCYDMELICDNIFITNTEIISIKTLSFSSAQSNIKEIEADVFTTDIFSISCAKKVSINELMILRGNMYYVNDKCTIRFNQKATVRITSNIDSITFTDEYAIVDNHFYLYCLNFVFVSLETLKVIGNSQNTMARNITVLNTVLTIRGEFSEESHFYLGGRISFSYDKKPTLTLLEKTTVVMTFNDLANYQLDDCKDCSLDIKSDDEIEKLYFKNDKFNISTASRSACLSSSYTLKITNNNKEKPLYIYSALNLKKINNNQILLNDFTTTIISDTWSNFKGDGKINFIAIGAEFTLKTESNYPLNCIRIFQADGIEVDPKLVVVYCPRPSKVPYNYTTVVSIVSSCFIIFIICLVFAVFFTPCGNWIGIKTYGIWGNDPHKYRHDDDEDAGLDQETSELNHFT